MAAKGELFEDVHDGPPTNERGAAKRQVMPNGA
jgi:hypothetical protein